MITPQEAIENAVRILQAAEVETNLATMEQLAGLADSWRAVAELLLEKRDELSS